MSDQPVWQDQDQDQEEEQEQPSETGTTPSGDRIVVVTPDGMGIVHQPAQGGRTTGGAGDAERGEQHGEPRNAADLVEQPAKVMRIGSMIKQLLEEVRSAPLDAKGRARLAEIHDRSISELKDGLAPELVQELERIALPFTEDAPSDAELRITQAQLVGWLEGLFHGIQTALVAQQMAAQAQLQQMRALPPGLAAQGTPGMPRPPEARPGHLRGGEDQGAHAEGTGQYL